MYSLNVPVPAAVAAMASDLARDLPGAQARPRGEHTLGVKRLGTKQEVEYARIEARTRELLAGQPPFEVRVSGLDCFESAAVGTTPVVYLTVESPELRRLHDRLAATFAPVDGIEGPDYTPHVTVARGGTVETAQRFVERDIEPTTWTVRKLQFWDAEYGQAVSSVALPA